MGATETIARFVLGMGSTMVPEPILHEGKRCIINYLAVALYASADPSMKILTGLFEEEGGNPQATIPNRIDFTRFAILSFEEILLPGSRKTINHPITPKPR